MQVAIELKEDSLTALIESSERLEVTKFTPCHSEGTEESFAITIYSATTNLQRRRLNAQGHKSVNRERRQARACRRRE